MEKPSNWFAIAEIRKKRLKNKEILSKTICIFA